ncbi:MAG: helix-turn-helix domain-containing protein [Spirochaetota bacterium]
MTTILFSLILYLFNYPDFFNALSYEITQKKYEKTILPQQDLKQLMQDLEVLMLQKRYYHDDEVRLEDVANELMITRNQLSRILNEQYQKNFYQFLNHYRILEAKELLLQEPPLSVLDIAFSVGFKSKSSFYKNFVQTTGVTPGSYRKQQLNKMNP